LPGLMAEEQQWIDVKMNRASGPIELYNVRNRKSD